MHRLNIVVAITVHCGHCQGGHCQHCPPRGCCQHGCPPRGCHQHGCCYHDCHQCSFCHCGCLLEGISFFTSVVVSLSLALSFKAGFHCLFMNYFFTSSRQLYDVPLNLLTKLLFFVVNMVVVTMVAINVVSPWLLIGNRKLFHQYRCLIVVGPILQGRFSLLPLRELLLHLFQAALRCPTQRILLVSMATQ
ncbi:hypothetical protein DEO72_LG8g1366 [Vigna unguiculata]|uniref:Uncharacterized protein n=1 Tax=Vigna unguiculata TaxID=3917 RepID=A0A4D6MRW3_VIGUN|nr:hypothetical protein DEO72_LG8g1366 [Vigna unguiculata]